MKTDTASLPKKRSTKDIWDWQVDRGDILLTKETLIDIESEIRGILLDDVPDGLKDWARDKLAETQVQLKDIESLVEYYDNQINFTVDYKEALTRIGKLKSSGKIKVLTGKTIALVIDGNLEIEYIKKCLRSVDNHIMFSKLSRCTDWYIEATAQPSFPDLYGDEMILTATIRHDVVAWLQDIPGTL